MASSINPGGGGPAGGSGHLRRLPPGEPVVVGPHRGRGLHAPHSGTPLLGGHRSGTALRLRPVHSTAALHDGGHGQPDRLDRADTLRVPLPGRTRRGLVPGEPPATAPRDCPARAAYAARAGRCGRRALLRRAVVRDGGAALGVAARRFPLRAPGIRHGGCPRPAGGGLCWQRRGGAAGGTDGRMPRPCSSIHL